jgi:hypothetical protein
MVLSSLIYIAMVIIVIIIIIVLLRFLFGVLFIIPLPIEHHVGDLKYEYQSGSNYLTDS